MRSSEKSGSSLARRSSSPLPPYACCTEGCPSDCSEPRRAPSLAACQPNREVRSLSLTAHNSLCTSNKWRNTKEQKSRGTMDCRSEMQGLSWVFRNLVCGAACTRTWSLMIHSSMCRRLVWDGALAARQPAVLPRPRHLQEGRRACPPSPPLRAD